ncbi:hypothetical protein M5689_019078 [Euphorbia peplus]|nr:hypothetical protein M5689_019078 [Euphorbia peplus]
MVSGVIHPTFKAACYALGFLKDDKEWDDCSKEASIWAAGHQLRHLFSIIVLFCEVSNPAQLWTLNLDILSEDVLYAQRKSLQFQNLILTEKQNHNYALMEIEQLLGAGGKSLTQFEGMEIPEDAFLRRMNNKLLLQETNYDIGATEIEYQRLSRELNAGQRNIFNIVMDSVELKKGKTIFVQGHGGTGKTFLWKTLLCKLRSE